MSAIARGVAVVLLLGVVLGIFCWGVAGTPPKAPRKPAVNAIIYSQPKVCHDLRTAIAKKLLRRGLEDFTLTIVDKDADSPGRELASCEGGAKKIMYSKEPK